MKTDEENDEYLFNVFEDLLITPNNESLNLCLNVEDGLVPDEKEWMRKIVASSFTLKDLIQETEKRGIQSCGFFDEDARILQACLDREYDEYVELKRKEKRIALEREDQERLLRKRQLFIDSEIREEKTALASDIKFASWSHLCLKGIGPSHCRVEVNQITVKTLARILWTTDKLVSLDLSNMNLSDINGSYIARALQNNKTLQRLDLSENSIGAKSCEVLAHSLLENRVLEVLILDSNPLGHPNVGGFRNLTTMLRNNQNLRRVSLFRCQTGVELGSLFAETLESNNSLISVDVSYNDWNYLDIQSIEKILFRNRILFQTEQENKARELIRKQKEATLQLEIQAKERMNEIEEEWLKSQKEERSDARRLHVEKQTERKRNALTL